MRYWRENKAWQELLGKTGVVVRTTSIKTAPSALQLYAPYSYAIVEIDGKQHECMSVSGELLEAGDHVQCVLRKTTATLPHEIIFYGIKIKKINKQSSPKKNKSI